MSARIPFCPLSRRPGALLKGYELPWHEQLDAVTTYFIDFCTASVPEPEQRMDTMSETGKSKMLLCLPRLWRTSKRMTLLFMVYPWQLSYFAASTKPLPKLVQYSCVRLWSRGPLKARSHKKRDSREKRDIVTWNCRRISDAGRRRRKVISHRNCFRRKASSSFDECHEKRFDFSISPVSIVSHGSPVRLQFEWRFIIHSYWSIFFRLGFQTV